MMFRYPWLRTIVVLTGSWLGMKRLADFSAESTDAVSSGSTQRSRNQTADATRSAHHVVASSNY